MVLQCVDSISSWMQSNRLQLNADKTDVMWCSSQSSARKLSQLPSCPLSIAGALFVPSVSLRTWDQEVFINSNLGAATQVQIAVSRCFAALHQLRQLCRYVTDDCFRSLVVSFVHSRLWQFSPGRASSLPTGLPPVCPQRCGSSGVSTTSLRPRHERPYN